MALQALPSVTAKNPTLRTFVNHLSGSVGMLSRERMEERMLARNVREPMMHSGKIQAVAGALRKLNKELGGVARENNGLDTMESVRVKVVQHESVSGQPKLLISRVESANVRRNARSIIKNGGKVVEDVSSAPMTVSRVVTDAIKCNVAIIDLDLKDALKQVASPIETGANAANFCIHLELVCADNGLLRNVATCRAVLYNRVPEVCRTGRDMDSLVVDSASKVVVVESA